MINFVAKGGVVDYVNSGSAIASGAVVVIGEQIGIAGEDIAASATGPVNMQGVYSLNKHSGAFTLGQKLFWDSSALELVGTPGANAKAAAGICFSAAASGDTTAQVLLGNIPKRVGAVASLAGTLTGTVDGTIVDVAAVATAGGNTYADTAINTAITSVNLQLKELQTTLNAVIVAIKAAGIMET